MEPASSYDQFLESVGASGQGRDAADVAAAVLAASVSLPQLPSSMMPVLYGLVAFFALDIILTAASLYILLRRRRFWVLQWNSGICLTNTRLFFGATMIFGSVLTIAPCIERILIYYGKVGFKYAILLDTVRWIPVYLPCFIYAHGVMAHLTLCRRPAASPDDLRNKQRRVASKFLNTSLLIVPAFLLCAMLPMPIVADVFMDNAINMGTAVASSLTQVAARGPTSLADLEPYLPQIRAVYDSLSGAESVRRAIYITWAILAGSLLIVFLPSFILHCILLFRLARPRSGPALPPTSAAHAPGDVDCAQGCGDSESPFVFTLARLRKVLDYRGPLKPAHPVECDSDAQRRRGESINLMVIVVVAYLCGSTLCGLSIYSATTSIHTEAHWELCHKGGSVAVAVLQGVSGSLLVVWPAWKIAFRGEEDGPGAASDEEGLGKVETTETVESRGPGADRVVLRIVQKEDSRGSGWEDSRRTRSDLGSTTFFTA